jgi:hypothetical protein|tara:strand:+ start:120 stop:365 length:246 start_codon:yes stop_codon:yes gene_type:complete
MKNTNTQRLSEIWQPTPTKTLVRKFPVKEGKNLPNSVTEDVVGMSLMPHYSTKQLRKIGRKQRKYSETFMMDIFANGGAIQ